MSGANLRSLQALIEFRESLSTIEAAAVDEVREMISSTQSAAHDAEQDLQERRDALWAMEDDLRRREAFGHDEQANVENVRIEVARAEAVFSEAQAASLAFQKAADVLTNRLIKDFTNARRFLDERIKAAKHYWLLSPSNATGKPADNKIPSIDNEPINAPMDLSSSPSRGDAMTSPLRGLWGGFSNLPDLPNGMKWVPTDNICWDGIDGASEKMEFNKVSKEDIRQMLENFESNLLPLMTQNRKITFDELSRIDGDHAYGNSSKSLRLCHDCLIGSGRHSDVIVLHSTMPNSKSLPTYEEHPAASTPAFEAGRKARIFGQGDDANPYRHLVGREGAASIWDQGWQWENSQEKMSGESILGFTSGRHRALVARELGWKFIPARVIAKNEEQG